MVLTRSADKRLTQPREEDLVLRSRETQEISGAISTPSRHTKRDAEVSSSPDNSHKRAKLTRVGGRPQEDVQVSSSASGGYETQAEVAKNYEIKPSSTTRNTQAPRLMSTTVALETAQNLDLASTPKSTEVFQTPSTAKHMRFGSEDHPQSTITIATGIDSSPTNDYATAEEIIDDSDDAPEASSTKVAQTNLAKEGAKKPKTRSTAQQPKEKADVQPANNGTSRISDRPTAEDFVAMRDKPDPTKTREDAHYHPPVILDANSDDTTNGNASQDAPSSTTSSNAQTSTQLLAAQDVENPGPTGPPHPQATRTTTFTSTVPRPSTTNTARLPDPPRSSISKFRGDKLASRYQLETTWKTKRSSFAV